MPSEDAYGSRSYETIAVLRAPIEATSPRSTVALLAPGDDQDVVSEGLAWYLHRVGAGPEGYAYDAALASWVRLIINDVDTGVYLSAEQRDKRFLQNRGIYIAGDTWLYKAATLGAWSSRSAARKTVRRW